MREKWYKLPDKIRFLLVGGMNAGISYLIYSVLCLILGESAYQVSLCGAWVISSVISYTTQRCLVFNKGGSVIKQYLKCCTTWVFSYMINAVLLELLVKKAEMNVYIAQILATGLCAIFTYIMFKRFAFRSYSNPLSHKGRGF